MLDFQNKNIKKSLHTMEPPINIVTHEQIIRILK